MTIKNQNKQKKKSMMKKKRGENEVLCDDWFILFLRKFFRIFLSIDLFRVFFFIINFKLFLF